MKVAAYCRVSTELDDQQNSLANQKEYFKTFIKQKEAFDWEFAGIYADEGISGTSMNKREAFLQMIEDAKNGKMDLILTKEVSRFARNTVDALIVIRTLKTYGVGVFFIIDHIDTRESDGEIRLTLMASLAQEESRKISERVKWGQKRQMEKGVVFGRSLLGYRLKNGILEVEETEAKLVRKIYDMFVNEQMGTNAIAKKLNESGYLTGRGNTWSNVAVRRILQNEKYVGDLVQKKTYTPDYLTHRKKKNVGQEAFVIKKNHHVPIVSREQFDAAQRQFSKSVFIEAEKYKNRYWCSGKIICGICGNPYVSRVRMRKDGSVSHRWLCICAVRYGRKENGCKGRSLDDEILKKGFWAGFNEKEKEQIKEKTMEMFSKESLAEVRVEKERICYTLKNKRTWFYQT